MFDYLNDMDFLIALDKLNIKTHQRIRNTSSGIGSEKQHEKDNTGSIVQHRLGIHQRRETFTGAQLFQQCDNGHWVCRTYQGSEHQCKCPVPPFIRRGERSDPYHQGSRQQHRNNDTRYGQYSGICQCFSKDMHVQFISSVEYQDRKKNIKYHIGISISGKIDR